MFGTTRWIVALLSASVALVGTAVAGVAKEFHISSTTVVMNHVTIETSTAYQLVTSRLNSEVKWFDESYRMLLKNNQIDELRAKLIHGLEPDGFMLHFVAEQGDLSALEGRRRQGNVYYLGNVVAAAQMTKRDFSAALYAPLRLNVYENANGGTTFEYDKPPTQFGQFRNSDIDKIAQSLDDHLLDLIKKVST
ncbi:MAG: hypothetical protein QOK23_4129 [Gammaproteobacteria bacterium]|jgi:uncharacterized protein (DUF302 family)|nr:hypothetical protein [Gammaproteobacteria bacterium]